MRPRYSCSLLALKGVVFLCAFLIPAAAILAVACCIAAGALVGATVPAWRERCLEAARVSWAPPAIDATAAWLAGRIDLHGQTKGLP